MANSRSLLITAAKCTLDDVDVAALADALGVRAARVEGQTLAEAYGQELLAQGDALILGSGDYTFDAVVAAAYGVPVVLVTPPPENTGHEEEVFGQKGAVLAGVVKQGALDAAALQVEAEAEPVMSAEVFESWLIGRAKENQAHIVLPEGEDDRILQAAHQLLDKDVAKLTILGDVDDIARRAEAQGLDLSKAQVIDHTKSELLEEFAAEFAELRQKKGITLEQARETMQDISYFATMMVHKGLADGMVSGAAHTTAHTIKPSFQIIKTAPGASVVSSIFLMVMRGRLWAFGDCAVNPNPTAEQLGEIAVVSAETASQFGIDPKVALLSSSTGASGAGPDVDRAVAALEAAKAANPELAVDGPLQFDAACDPGVGAKKAPDSPVAGQANVFIFPDLEAGNAGYKIAQRTGGALAVGPVLQGLNKPVNDLSRGATVPDIVNTVAITAIQAGAK